MVLGDLTFPQEEDHRSCMQPILGYRRSRSARRHLPADRCGQSSRPVEFSEIISQRFKLVRDVVGQSLEAHPISDSPHALGMTVEKGLCFSRLSNLFFNQYFQQ